MRQFCTWNGFLILPCGFIAKVSKLKTKTTETMDKNENDVIEQQEDKSKPMNDNDNAKVDQMEINDKSAPSWDSRNVSKFGSFSVAFHESRGNFLLCTQGFSYFTLLLFK